MLTNPKFLSLVEAVSNIAITSMHGAVRGTEVCIKLGLPERYLESEFQNLVHSGILKSVRGPKGGYVLGKEKRNISLADIFAALEKPEKAPKQGKFAGFLVKKLDVVGQELKKITLHDLLNEAKTQGIVDFSPPKSDFAI